MKCKTCCQPIKSDCDWQQGRCPHRMPTLDEITLDKVKVRIYNLFIRAKRWLR